LHKGNLRGVPQNKQGKKGAKLGKPSGEKKASTGHNGKKKRALFDASAQVCLDRGTAKNLRPEKKAKREKHPRQGAPQRE